MTGELVTWLDAQNIDYTIVDREVVNIPDFGRLFVADLSGVGSIFRGEGDTLTFNLLESPEVRCEFPGIKNRGIKKCKAKDNQIIIHFSSVPLF